MMLLTWSQNCRNLKTEAGENGRLDDTYFEFLRARKETSIIFKRNGFIR
jgi:hypothetical protein